MFFVTHPLLMGTRLCPCRGCCELGGTGIFLDKDSEEGLLGHKVVLFLFEEPPHCFHGDCTAFPPQSHGAPARSTPLGSCGDCRSSHAGSWPFLAPVARAHLRPVHGCPFAWTVLSPPRCHLSREAAHLAHHTCAFTCPGAWLSLIYIGHGLRGGTLGSGGLVTRKHFIAQGQAVNQHISRSQRNQVMPMGVVSSSPSGLPAHLPTIQD